MNQASKAHEIQPNHAHTGNSEFTEIKPQIVEHHKESTNRSYFYHCHYYCIALLTRTLSSEIALLLQKDTVLSLAIIFSGHQEDHFKESDHSKL